LPEIELTPTTFAYGGEVIGRLADGRAVFIPFALPGERVRVRLVEEKRRFARAELLTVLQPAAERSTPRCPHYMHCGGCHYQHLTYEAQLAAKTAILQDQLERIGGLAHLPMQPAWASQPWNYRNHIQFHLTSEGQLGFHAASSERIIPIQECHLPQPEINALWPQLDLEAIPGLERLAIRQGTDGDLQLILESSDPQPPEMLIEGLPISAVHLSPAGALVLAGSESLVIDVQGHPFQVSAGSFFQVNTAMAEALVTHVMENLTLHPNSTVIDVYCGVGLFSAFLAPHVGRLVGIEASPAACEDFTVNLDAYDHVELYEAAAEEVLPAWQGQPDVILVDPPRAGLTPTVIDACARLQPAQLVYVSCDPATLARDARRLIRAGFQLRLVTPFDLFPQTYHIESVSFWGRD